MQALVKAKAEPGLWLRDVPEPTVGINDVLIKVHKTGICGTDLHIYNWDAWAQKTIPVPMVVGHEFVGEVVNVGSNVSDFHTGEIVSAEGHVVCGRCRNCLAGRRHLCKDTVGIGVNRTGAFAEFISVPMTNVWHHAPGVDEDVASIFDPFGNAMHTALSFDLLGEDVLITGAGPIGVMAVAIAKHAGARYVVITDVNDYRLNLAKMLGADVALNDCLFQIPIPPRQPTGRHAHGWHLQARAHPHHAAGHLGGNHRRHARAQHVRQQLSRPCSASRGAAGRA